MDRYWAEQIMAYMILEKYLKEDFHFTAYNTISYIRKGPNIPKKEDIILFHGARVLKLPERDVVWENDTSSTKGANGNSKTPTSNAQPLKRRKDSSAKSSVKRTKTTTPTGSASNRDNQPSSSSGTFTSATTPKKSDAATRSSVTNSANRSSLTNSANRSLVSKVSTSKDTAKKAATNGSAVIDEYKRLLEVNSQRKSEKIDDIVCVSVTDNQNVIEILDEDST